MAGGKRQLHLNNNKKRNKMIFLHSRITMITPEKHNDNPYLFYNPVRPVSPAVARALFLFVCLVWNQESDCWEPGIRGDGPSLPSLKNHFFRVNVMWNISGES